MFWTNIENWWTFFDFLCVCVQMSNGESDRFGLNEALGFDRCSAGSCNTTTTISKTCNPAALHTGRITRLATHLQRWHGVVMLTEDVTGTIFSSFSHQSSLAHTRTWSKAIAKAFGYFICVTCPVTCLVLQKMLDTDAVTTLEARYTGEIVRPPSCGENEWSTD